jgi:glycerophosphoryl diester phosphodiesterase
MQLSFLNDWRAAAQHFKARWRALLLFELFCKALSIALIAPASAWFLRAILRLSGDPVISNYDLFSFFFSLQGLLLIVVSASAAFALLFFEIGGLMVISLDGADTQQLSAIRALKFMGLRSMRLLILGLRQFLIVFAIGLAVLSVAAAVKETMLSGGEIYYYLTIRPTEFWYALAVIGSAAALGAIAIIRCIIRWIYALPLVLFEGLPPREALTESVRLVRTNGGWWIFKRTVVCGGGIVILAVAATLLHIASDRIAMLIAGADVSWVLVAIATSLAFGVLLGAVVSFVGSFAVALLIAELYAEARGRQGLTYLTLSESKALPILHRLNGRVALLTAAACLTVLAAMTSISIAGRLDLEHSVKITAHRGSSKAAPENTISALKQAIVDGADYAEIDVQRTADGVVVLLHDTDLRRVAGLRASIWELTFGDIQGLDVGSWFSADFEGEEIPTLVEAIEAVKGKLRLNIELKVNGHDDGLVAEVAQILKQTRCRDDCNISSLDYRTLLRIAEYDPEVRRGLIITASIGDVSRFDVDFLAVNARNVTRDLIERTHRAGMEAHVWTVNDIDQMLGMLHLGVDNILTSRPELLVSLLKARREMSDVEKTLLFLADLAPTRAWVTRFGGEDSKP